MTAIVAMTVGAGSAQAAPILYTISGGFSGTFSLDYDTQTLSSLSLDIGGRLFDETNSSALFQNSGYTIGGNIGGASTLMVNNTPSPLNNDFILFLPQSSFQNLQASIGYSTNGMNYYSGREVTIRAGSSGAVPEPATWAMFIGGFGLVGAGMRRRLKFNFKYV
ncbi:PEPxxWA-CTERM sorting domain-containing protein [Sphingomonas sp. BIUV-7]|uniref:PEPxxWA-CTERM sorting domain-containing protein n=1 Tax=Sphingomonas natans TaxID=3063330 RepID=A0ABT8YC79_9SPHN|nr:PEPxxWA-CTERM sorting domain-containing protein [Sphingomonas sp. BIUV-7]MDO6415938.1 PEPxxWA-CTERM sorting domain-containing protein [Sphingomonas sp. BIUV-7]